MWWNFAAKQSVIDGKRRKSAADVIRVVGMISEMEHGVRLFALDGVSHRHALLLHPIDFSKSLCYSKACLKIVTHILRKAFFKYALTKENLHNG